MTGPGSELKKILAAWPFRIVATHSCPCNDFAATMDRWGADESERRLPEIVAHLEAQAKAREMAFSSTVAKVLVRRAIKLARQNGIDHATLLGKTKHP